MTVAPWTYIPGNAVFYEKERAQQRLNKIRERFDKMRNYWSPIFEQARKEDAFIAGFQWDDIIRKERESAGRPMFTFNLLPAFTRQIINMVRQDMPQLRVKPVQSDKRSTPKASNQQGTKDYSMADIYMGIWRHIEHVSRADQAYETALTHAVWHAFGYFTLNTKESPTDPFEQDLVIERVKDSYSLVIDPSAQEADFSDMQDAFVFTRISKDAFERIYPGHQTGSFNVTVEAGLFGDWFDRDSLQIATYWWIDYVDDEVVRMSDGRVHYMSEVDHVLDDWARMGLYVERDDDGEKMIKAVKRPVAKWQRFTATEFITPEMTTVFDRIPIFPVLGDEIVVDGRTRYMSAIRDAMDAQKSYNYHRTTAIESLSLQPKAPFVMSAEQIKGHEREWERANRENIPYLLYNQTIEAVPPPQRAPPPTPAVAELQQAQFDAQDIQAIIGLHDASLGAESNEKSGKAVLARQRQGLTSTYHFPANLGRAIEAAGRVAVQAIPKIYTTERVMRIRMPDDAEDLVVINQKTVDQATGRTVLSNDLSYGKYDVVIDTGPSYATQREESVEAMLELLSVMPPEAAISVVHLIVQNLAFPGADKVASVLRKLIPDHLKSEDERAADLPKGVTFDENGQPVNEDGTPYEPQLSPEMQILAQQNQIEQAKVQAEVATAEAKSRTAEADIAEAELAMARLQAGDGEPDTAAFDGIQTQLDSFSEMLEEHKRQPEAHAEAVDAKLSELLAELVPAIRKLVDAKLESAAKDNEAAMNEREKERDAKVKESESKAKEAQKASTDKTSAALTELTKILREMAKRPKAITFETGPDGTLKSAKLVEKK